MDISNLQPNKVFYYFQEISQIPRGSGNEKGISDYLISFAKKHNLWCHQDESYNVIIKKSGSMGYENVPAVILQGHMDMVCEKNQEVTHDFEKDPIQMIREGDFIHAKGTTLGGDNGIAVAYALALLSETSIKHPPIEAVFTTNEETGMDGAQALDVTHLSGKRLINIDSEEEGSFLVSCAGGMRVSFHLPVTTAVKQTQNMFRIGIRGLSGGHSGMDIIKQRANANRLMGRILADLVHHTETEISSIWGGAKDNAIPREADCILSVNQTIEELKEFLLKWENIFRHEFLGIEKEIIVTCQPAEMVQEVWTKETTNSAIALLALMPNGVIAMSKDINGLVETSNNLGVIDCHENEIVFTNAVRSSVSSRKKELCTQMELLAGMVGASISIKGEYPAWEYQENSQLRDLCCSVYEEMYHSKPKIGAIHAGLECGLFREKMPDCDMISLGPNMFDVHTPQERVSISSVKRVWEFLLSILEHMK